MHDVHRAIDADSLSQRGSGQDVVIPWHPRRAAPSGSGRLGRRLILWLATVAIATTIVAGAFVYAGLFRQSLEDAKGDLIRHANARASQESQIFNEALRMQGFLRTLILEKLAEPMPEGLEQRFWKIASRSPDGAIRNGALDLRGRPFDGRRASGLFLNRHADLTPDLMRRLVLFAELCDTYGPLGRPTLRDLFIDTPENGSLLYWPEVPEWSANCAADFDQNAEVYEVAATVKNNPTRRPVWTDLYFDAQAGAWLISCVTPVDRDGVQVATIGNDLVMNELIERFGRGGVPGGTGMIVRQDGRLIVHPAELDRMKKLNGGYRVQRDGTPEMQAIFRGVKTAAPNDHVLDLPEWDRVVAFAPVPEINGYHVEIMPRSLMLAEANRGTLFFVMLLAGVLLVQFAVLVLVLRKSVVRPILALTESAAQFTPENFTPVPVDPDGDELTALTHGFNEMGRAVVQQHRRLQEQSVLLETEVRRRTLELEQARDDAQSANRAKSEFLANVSHELRTPLNAMVGFAQLLSDDRTLSADQRRRVDGIVRAGDHLLALVHDTLDLSRMEVGNFSLTFAPMALDALIDEIAGGVAPLCREKGLGFRLVRLDPTAITLLGDATRVRQILINLLTNAVQFTSQGEVSLTVSLRRVNPESATRWQVVFEVIDTGPGVPVERREAIFERCAPASTGGMSLGLSISRELARRMGGDIHVTTAPTGGSCFSFCLECDRVPGAVASDAAASAPEPSALPSRDPALLLVDDVLANREVLRECLQELGYTRIFEAADGEEALAVLGKSHIDLVITDLSMPVLDGFGLFSRMREDARWARIPVIAISAGMVDRHGRTALEAGFDAFLAKPYRIAALHAAVCKLIGAPSAAPEHTSEAATEVAPTRPADARTASSGASRILILDDDPMNREVLCAILEGQGYELVVASSGEEALVHLFSEPYRLVLFDYHMPYLNGAAFVRRFRKQCGEINASTVFVCIPGALTDDERRELAAAGVGIILEKPYRNAEIRDLVSRILRPQVTADSSAG